MILLNIGILAIVALGVWWLTGLDKSFNGESKRDRHFTRTLRTVGVVFLFAVLLACAQSGGAAGIPLLLIVPVSIALLLRSSLSELFAGGFLRLVDPTLHDGSAFDLKRAQRHRDNIAWLIHHGKRDEAIKLCDELKENGELDATTLETILEFLGVKQERAPAPQPLKEIADLRAQKKFTEAEHSLKLLLAKNPADSGAALMLMRLYTQDWQQSDKAAEVLRELEQQPHVSADHIEFARRSVVEWTQPQSKPAEDETTAESLEEMLTRGFYGTAIELLELKIKAPSPDFDSWLKLAEIHALHCENFARAEKIIRQMEKDPLFSAPQIAAAEAKLKEWREMRRQRK